MIFVQSRSLNVSVAILAFALLVAGLPHNNNNNNNNDIEVAAQIARLQQDILALGQEEKDSPSITIPQQESKSNASDEGEELVAEAEPTSTARIAKNLPLVRASENLLLELGELGALLANGAYVGSEASPPVITDPPTLIRAIQVYLESKLTSEGLQRYQPQVKAVFEYAGVNTMFYALTINMPTSVSSSEEASGDASYNKACVLAFRGTVGSVFGANWKRNIQSLVSRMEDQRPAGMQESYDPLQPQVLPLVHLASDMTSEADYRNIETFLPGGVFVVGHSLGGSLATYAMLDILTEVSKAKELEFNGDLLSRFPPNYFKLYTYGQPRDFSLERATFYQPILGAVKTRFVAEGDAIPNSLFPISKKAKSRFSHTGRAMFLDCVSQKKLDFKTRDFIARDAATLMDFGGMSFSGYVTEIRQAFLGKVNPVKMHVASRYMQAIDSARKALGDMRSLIVTSTPKLTEEQAIAVEAH